MFKLNTPPPSTITRKHIAAFVKVFVLAAFLVAVAQSSALAAVQDFTLTNYSGRTIYSFYVSPANKGDWEEDVLSRTLPHGQSRTITFSNRETRKFWDMKAVCKDGTTWTWYGIDLEVVSQVIVDGSGTLTQR